MKSKTLAASLLASTLFAGLAAAPAFAQGTFTPRIDQQQQAISARIQQGLASGQITPSEAQVLYRRDREIQNREIQFKSGGNITPLERQQLSVDLAGLGNEVEQMIANRNTVTQAGTRGIDNREWNIGQRIDDGVRSGRISRREADQLHRQERVVARHDAAFRADGVLTSQERRQLQGEIAALRAGVDRALRDRRG